MNNNELLKLIEKNGGATLDKNGNALNKKSGYMVSLDGYELKIEKIELFTQQLIKKYLKIAKKLKAYFGMWIDNNILYLDISIWTASLDYAKKTGLKNNQLAIYDIKNEKSIYLHTKQ